jgi:hypothetical protein
MTVTKVAKSVTLSPLGGVINVLAARVSILD